MTDTPRSKPPAPGAKLTRRERQIMDILYRDGGATVADVMAQLPDPPSYSAVRATMNVLEEKGHGRHKQDGPRYVYLPAVPRERARLAAMHHLLQRSDSKLSATDFERLAAEVRKANQEGR